MDKMNMTKIEPKAAMRKEGKFIEPVGKTCRDCRHYAEFVSVCTNGESEHRADFVPEDGCCEKGEVVKNG